MAGIRNDEPACCWPSFLPLGRGNVLEVSLGAVLRVALQVVVLHVVTLLGYGDAGRCVLSTLVRAEHMMLLRSRSSVPFWPLPDTDFLPCVFYSLIHCLCTFLLSGALAVL